MAVLKYVCSHCGSRHRVERVEPIVAVRSWYCPGCGHACSVVQDHEENYWYALAVAIGLPATRRGVKITKEIYDTWDTNEHRTFRAYVDALRKEGSPA